MYENFSERALNVMEVAENQALRELEGSIGTRHLLIGLASQEYGMAARIFETLGVDRVKALDAWREKTLYMPRPQDTLPAGSTLATLIRHAYETAKARGGTIVGTDDLLLAACQSPMGVSTGLLARIGVTTETVMKATGDFRAAKERKDAKPKEAAKESKGTKKRLQVTIELQDEWSPDDVADIKVLLTNIKECNPETILLKIKNLASYLE